MESGKLDNRVVYIVGNNEHLVNLVVYFDMHWVGVGYA